MKKKRKVRVRRVVKKTKVAAHSAPPSGLVGELPPLNVWDGVNLFLSTCREHDPDVGEVSSQRHYH